MSVLNEVLAELADESQQLDQWVAGLGAEDWARVTTPEGWTVTHQIAHLHWTDTASLAAINEPPIFADMCTAAAADPFGYVDRMSEQTAQLEVADLLARWRSGRHELATALQGVPEGQKIMWFGPPMSATSMATARLMETWAHSHDVGDALGMAIAPTSRAKRVCHIGVRARGFAYMVRGESDPGVDIRVELTGPDGGIWTWGPVGAAERVTGSGYDFALLVTRRRHLDDLNVKAEGAHAAHWLTIAQAFAGLPGSDPLPLADR